ncbi:hypothetical protein D3C81_1854600 [compost metagenome]
MGQRFDAGGVHRLHLLHQREEVVQLGECLRGLGIAGFDAGQMRDALDVGECESHGVMRRGRRVQSIGLEMCGRVAGRTPGAGSGGAPGDRFVTSFSGR